MCNIDVDFGKICGKVKPMHAINNIPTVPTTSEEMYQRINAANIPYSRLHDTGGAYGGSRYVDIANVFPDFDADENDPKCYDFAFTDVLLQNMTEHNIKPFYRLGATIENYHKIKAYNIYPPKDNEKWARICERIIRHYNYGWANGFHMNIEHWEIWNEPDNEPVIEDNPMWKGTREEYFKLYKTTATHLKKCFPDLKIGGYSSCGFYALSDNDFSEIAHSSTRVDYFIEFFLDFLDYARKNKLPLDFFSWHSYAGIKENVMYALYAREKLDEYGFNDCEVYLNEWNPGTANRGTQKDASDILSMMCAMQDTPTDMCMYYNTLLTSSYCGAFNPITFDVLKAYYAFYVFGRLYKLHNQVECRVDGENVYALAATDGSEKGIAIANNSDTAINIKVRIKGTDAVKSRIYATDENNDFNEIPSSCDKIEILPYGIIYVEID
ncbi:MAG: hypothetical protein ACI4DY_12345 [Monoglobaceae bacterium]